MFRQAIIPLCAIFAVSSAGSAFAALENDVSFSPLPEVKVALNDTTGSLHATPHCPAREAQPMVLYDAKGHVVALVYITSDADEC